MLKPGFLLQALPVFAIILAAFLFIVYKMLSRLKPRDDVSSTATGFTAVLQNSQTSPELKRLDGSYPAVVRTDKESFEAEAKEITLVGAFVICDHPLPVGESLELSLELADPIALQATVTWNNSNVPKEEIVASGMRVRFLDVSPEARSVLLGPPAATKPPESSS